MHRRKFLQSAGLLAAGAAAPTIVPSRVFGAQAPSNRVTLAFIGTGRQCQGLNIPQFMAVPGVQVVAVCDVDSWRVGQAKQLVESTYAKQSPSGAYKGCDTYRDFRAVLARRDVDAVMISTPDHWHVPMAMLALQAGKDVSLEKPITRYIGEGRRLANEVVARKRIFRVDSEFRSLDRMHRAVELVRNGAIGTLKTIRVSSPREEFPQEAAIEAPVPAELDYDMWLGPAPKVPYMQKRVHNPRDLKGRPGWFRSTMYADGMLTNWGAHLVDICQWANGTERTGPVEVQATGRYHDDPVWDVLETFDARFRFANGVEMFYTMDKPRIRFEGDKGWLVVNYDKSADHPEYHEASDPKILSMPIPADGVRFPLRSERVDFIDSVKSRRKTLEDEEIGQRTISICHLAHIGIKRQGALLKWDPARERFTNDEEANRHLEAPAGRTDWGTK
ncbi:oxidoreductase [Luteitalea sp. TBR-22]|uniref:Gfo/Idh/MocA family protein n=1 Tax=Luteitalea sp. TBR-22 TaxID=2802971 RepID=UPI001AFB79B4|nr:Gfo/Idh/MocA family oxidoreductase [Luteitalea sp. TBR-22]BCS32297.1 oxidoreductase [Luteitalea sp. TBR-22]